MDWTRPTVEECQESADAGWVRYVVRGAVGDAIEILLLVALALELARRLGLDVPSNAWAFELPGAFAIWTLIESGRRAWKWRSMRRFLARAAPSGQE